VSSLLALAVAVALQAWNPAPSGAMRLTPADGASDYYARFSRALPSDRSHFPVGVWFESVLSPADVSMDRDAGLNLYVVLTRNSNLSLVQSGGMQSLLQQDEWGTSAAAQANPATAGWVLGDEIDMQSSPEAGYAELDQARAALAPDGTLRFSNYGKGVTFWLTDREAVRYVNGFQDVLSADNYWFTDENICSGGEGGSLLAGGADLSPAECHRAANYGATVRRVRGLVQPAGSKPVWAVVELGHPFSESDWPTITPPEVRAAVWQSLIAGARGIVYFNHSFGGSAETQHILRDGADPSSPYAPIRSVVTATNREIQALAPVLNSPTVSSGWSQAPGTTAMVKWEPTGTGSKPKKRTKCKSKKHRKRCGKKHRTVEAKKKTKCKSSGKHKKCKGKKKPRQARGRLFLFAGSAGGPVQGRFSLPCVGDATAAVVGENRSVRVRGGSFSDRFADGNAIHIYRLDGGSKCGLSPAP
jgi:hypothetical protein